VGDQAFANWVVASLPQLGSMQVHARLSDVDDGTVKVGMTAECILDAYPDKRFSGQVKLVSASASAEGKAARRFFNVMVTLSEQAADLMRPGMSVRVQVLRRRADAALLVPRGALRAPAGRLELRLRSGATQAVQVDFCSELWCAVRGELREGTALLPERSEGPDSHEG
jgi:hypothetical protein